MIRDYRSWSETNQTAGRRFRIALALLRVVFGRGVQFGPGAVLQHSQTPSLRAAGSRTRTRTKRLVS